MYDLVLREIQRLVAVGLYRVEEHAEQEMDQDFLTIYDLEQGIQTGNIVERQLDHRTYEWKYIIAGYTIIGDTIEIVVKLVDEVVVITVYRI